MKSPTSRLPGGGEVADGGEARVVGYLPSVESFRRSAVPDLNPGGAAFTVVGAEASDHLGCDRGQHKIAAGDVTGDGVGGWSWPLSAPTVFKRARGQPVRCTSSTAAQRC